jgi:hypothetical protein
MGKWVQTALLIILLLCPACSANDLQPPPQTADGWQTSTLDETGLGLK